MKNTSIINTHTLASLGRNHYNGLLLVLKIRRTLRYGVEINKIAALIIEDFNTNLQPHLISEEEWLFPTLPEENTLRIHAEYQHAALRRMVASFCDSPFIPSSLPEEFADLLEDHIGFEERTLFPYIERMNKQEI